MGPKAHHRTTSASRLGTNTRTNSSSRLATNLQFTQKEPQYSTSKQPELAKTKKNGSGPYDPHGRAPQFQRITSSHRISSKDQLGPYQATQKRAANAPSRTNGTKPRAGFTIASSPSDEADDDEWVSSESGAATPNHVQDSDSGAESELVTPVEQNKQLEKNKTTRPDAPTETVADGERERVDAATPISRVDTARPSGLDPQPRGEPSAKPEIEPMRAAPPPPLSSQFDRRSGAHPMATVTEPSSIDNRPAVSRPPNKRHSSTRPPSTHSISSRHDSLRPHPLIRGHSFGIPNKLAPLAMTTDNASAQLSSTPPVNIEQPASHSIPLSSSPATTISGSPSSPTTSTLHHSLHQQKPAQRRTSISSIRSVATLPVHPTLREPPRSGKDHRDRHRTLSTISSSSSSAAISALAHIPATRPPSPQRMSVNFPPPSHPQFHTAGVHSLLPPPYLTNHLTVLAHRTPLRESYDRVRRAKLEARR